MNAPENPPAFPSQPLGQDGLPSNDLSPGMTLRDDFAGRALPAVIDFVFKDGRTAAPLVAGAVAKIAYGIADAMLAERATGGAA